LCHDLLRLSLRSGDLLNFIPPNIPTTTTTTTTTPQKKKLHKQLCIRGTRLSIVNNKKKKNNLDVYAITTQVDRFVSKPNPKKKKKKKKGENGRGKYAVLDR
jgi:hypothetical protein